jgi:hypothetical protein
MMPTPLETMRRLGEILELENAALAAMDLGRVTALLPMKAAATANLREAGERSSKPTPETLAAAGRIDRLARDNRRLLERAIVAQQRVIGIMVGAAQATRAREPAYGASGSLATATGPLALSTRA